MIRDCANCPETRWKGIILFIFLDTLLLLSNSYYLLSSSPILSQSCQSIFTFSTPSILYFMSPIIPPSPFGLSSSSPLLSLASWIRCAYAASSCCIHKIKFQIIFRCIGPNNMVPGLLFYYTNSNLTLFL